MYGRITATYLKGTMIFSESDPSLLKTVTAGRVLSRTEFRK